MKRTPLSLNGRAYEIDAPDDERLLTTLRERLGLTGTKLACGRGECGACSVLIDGTLSYACVTLTAACAGSRITTIEGLATEGDPGAVQEAFRTHDAVQCGFCTPGQIIAASAMLARHSDPSAATIVREMSGNLCRCGTYPRIVEAIRSLASVERAASA